MEGALEYHGGVAEPGGYVYEPSGAIHEATKHDVDTVYFVQVHNGAVFYNEDGSEGPVYDWRSVMALRDAHNVAKSAA